MKILPSYSFRVETDQSLEELERLLKDWVEPQNMTGSDGKLKKFKGTVGGGRFKISYIHLTLDRTRPVIYGEIRPGHKGATVHLHIKLQIFNLILLWFFLIVCGVGSLGFLGAILAGAAEQPIMILPLIGLMVVGWGIISMSLWTETKKVKPVLEEMFGAPLKEKDDA